MRGFTDNRIPLESQTLISIRNISNGVVENCKIEKVQGKGGSCIVYRAIIYIDDEPVRPILLKEFYPNIEELTPYFSRDNDTHALKFNAPEKFSIIFKKERENFLEICRRQQNFYLQNARQNADTLVDIEGFYYLGDTYYLKTRSVSGCSWDKINDSEETLYQLVKTTISLLHELKLLHANSLIHNDIKPSNVYVYVREMVTLLDFGSVQQLYDGRLTGQEILTYSTEYASPELRDTYGKSGVDFEDSCECVTEKSDLYSVAAVLYTKITGKFVPHDDDEDILKKKRSQTLSEVWKVERNGRFKNIPMRICKELENFFDIMLAIDPDERFNLEEMEQNLISIKNRTAPQIALIAKRFKPANAIDNFLGRKFELQQLQEFLKSGKQMIFICGIGGIGKSELTLKFSQENQAEYDFFKVTFNDTFEKTIISLQTDPPCPIISNPQMNPTRLYDWNLNCLRGYNDSAVLIIDNFDLNSERMFEEMHSETYKELKRLKLKIVFTCREFPPIEESCIKIGALSDVELLELIRTYYNGVDTEGNLQKLIQIAEKNTLLVEQMARMLKTSLGEMTPAKLVEQMNQGAAANGDIYEKLKSLFNISRLRRRAKKIMAETVLFPQYGLNATTFLRCHDEDDIDKIKILEMSGWIKHTPDNFLVVHPLIDQICQNELLQDFQDECENFVQKYYSEFDNLSAEERGQQWYQRLVIAANAADFLKDIEGAHSKKAGELCFNEEWYADSLRFLEKHWEKYSALNPDLEPMVAAESLLFISLTAQLAFDFNAGLFYANKALNYAEIAFGEDNPQLWRWKIQIICCQIAFNDWEGALDNWIEIMNLFEKYNFDDSMAKVTLFGLFISIFQNIIVNVNICGNSQLIFEKIEHKYEKIFNSILKKLFDFMSGDNLNWQNVISALPGFFSLMAQFLLLKGEYEKVLEIHDMLSYAYNNKIFENDIGQNLIMLQNNNYKAMSLTMLGRFEEAKALLDKVLKIAENKLGTKHIITISIYDAFARYFQKLGDFRQAILWCDKALENVEFLDEENLMIKILKDLKKELNSALQENQKGF